MYVDIIEEEKRDSGPEAFHILHLIIYLSFKPLFKDKKMARRVIGLGSIILYLLRNSIFIEEERQSYKAVCVHRAPNQGASDKE